MMDVPLAYLPSNATRVYVKAVGDLLLRGADTSAVVWRLTEPSAGATTTISPVNQGSYTADCISVFTSFIIVCTPYEML